MISLTKWYASLRPRMIRRSLTDLNSHIIRCLKGREARPRRPREVQRRCSEVLSKFWRDGRFIEAIVKVPKSVSLLIARQRSSDRRKLTSLGILNIVESSTSVREVYQTIWHSVFRYPLRRSPWARRRAVSHSFRH